MFLKIKKAGYYPGDTKVLKGYLVLKEKEKGAINKWLPHEITIKGDLKNKLENMEFSLFFKRKVQDCYGFSLYKSIKSEKDLKLFSLFKKDFFIEIVPLQKKVIRISFRRKGEYVKRSKFTLSTEMKELVKDKSPGFYEIKFLSPVIELFFKKGNNESWRKKVEEIRETGFEGTLFLDILSRMHFGNEYKLIHFSPPKVLVIKEEAVE